MTEQSAEKFTVSRDEIVEAVSKMLEPIARKGVLACENRWGIDVLYKKSDPAVIMFHFVTQDLLEVNLEFDILELERRGREYMDSRVELILDQLEKARAERQRENQLVLNTHRPVESAAPPKPTGLASAVHDVVSRGTIH